MAWIVHHLDALEHHAYRYASTYSIRVGTTYAKTFNWRKKLSPHYFPRTAGKKI